MSIPADYVERVYAGVLGKIIGVYLGRPFEGWTYDKIMAELGEVWYYVHEKRGVPLIVADDDISGTFTFIRAMEDHGCTPELTAEQIGQTWLNYIVEKKAILWWGGMGNSTEHTAFLRLKSGTPAPRSGSMELNGKVVAEQIGAQIFIDGWAMVAPGDPELAATLARRAASVSHDGEAIHGAVVVAAMESMAFVECDLGKLLDGAVSHIPADSIIARMIGQLRKLRQTEPDWRKAYEFMKANYGYDKYGGNCHIVPNHGLIILALLWESYPDPALALQKSLMIVNTCGWDTDCNSGNVGCIQGLRFGLAGIDGGPDWRGPVADRLYLPTADGGSCINDAATVATQIANMGLRLAEKKPVAPKNGARFHFSMPGSVQGFVCEDSPEARGVATVSNPDGAVLHIDYRGLSPGRFARVARATFLPPEALKGGSYSAMACPTLYSGQTVRASVRLSGAAQPRQLERELVRGVEVERHPVTAPSSAPVTCKLYIRAYGDKDELVRIYGPAVELKPGPTVSELRWTVPDTGGMPVAEIGLELSAPARADGKLMLDTLTWGGAPNLTLRIPDKRGIAFGQAWAAAAELVFAGGKGDEFRLIQNAGRGMAIHGAREWRDYRASAEVVPHLAKAAGLAARVQGLLRYYALLLDRPGKVRLVKLLDEEKTLGEKAFPWELDRPYKLAIEVRGARITASVDDRMLFEVTDATQPLDGGAIALVVEEGRCGFGPVRVEPLI